jgi:histone deacetylase 6
LTKCVNSKTNRKFTLKEIREIEEVDQKKYEELKRVRLKYLSSQIKHKKSEKMLHLREQLADGLHVIDFEQLKIENQALMEKIQEREDEIVKLKNKRTHSVQVTQCTI